MSVRYETKMRTVTTHHAQTTTYDRCVTLLSSCPSPLIVAVREAIPITRSKHVKVSLLEPLDVVRVTSLPGEKDDDVIGGAPGTARLLSSNTLEMTVRLEKSSPQSLRVRFAVETPSEMSTRMGARNDDDDL